MQFSEYAAKAKETAIYPEYLTVLYPTLGLVDEIGEFKEAVRVFEDPGSILKEGGDVLWYVAALVNDLGLMEQVQRTSCGRPSALDISAAKICGLVKKTYRDDEGTFRPEVKQEITELLSAIYMRLDDALVNSIGCTIEQAMEMNIEKLQGRKNRGTLQGSGDDR